VIEEHLDVGGDGGLPPQPRVEVHVSRNITTPVVFHRTNEIS
jgi:hypothetical protein